MTRTWRFGSDHEKTSVLRSIPSREGLSRMIRILFQLASGSPVLFRDTMIVMGTISHRGEWSVFGLVSRIEVRLR